MNPSKNSRLRKPVICFNNYVKILVSELTSRSQTAYPISLVTSSSQGLNLPTPWVQLNRHHSFLKELSKNLKNQRNIKCP